MGDIIGLDGLRKITESIADTNIGSTDSLYKSAPKKPASRYIQQGTNKPSYGKTSLHQRMRKIFGKPQTRQKPMMSDRAAGPMGKATILNRLGNLLAARIAKGSKPGRG